MNFGFFLVGFMVLMVVLREFEVYWYQKNKIAGVKKALWTINFLGVSYAVFLILVVLEYFLIKRNINIAVTSAGLFLWIVRFFLKYWGATTLNEFWSADIEIRENHRLVKKGPYRFLRHPVYFSNVIDVIAVTLIANSYYMLFTGAVIMIVFIYSRIPFEEKALIEKLGDEYRQYQKETYALIPFIL